MRDGHRAAELSLEQVVVSSEDCIARGEKLQTVLDAVLKTTVDYCQRHEQFGRRLSKQQIVQHRLVGMYMACERGRFVSEQAVQLRGAIGFNEIRRH